MKKFLKKFVFTIMLFFTLLMLNSNSSEAKSGYYITVNNGSNVVTVYGMDNAGNYTNPIKSMVCSCGIATPRYGKYNLDFKYRWLALFGGVYGQYCTRITGNILFHSVPYLQKGNPASLEYWEYDKLGTSASAGCVRLTTQDAKWIYENCPSGTTVEFLNNSDVGPLGKPEAMKISNSPNRNWDPTDESEGNPWKIMKLDNKIFNYIYYADVNGDLKAAFGYNENLLTTHFLIFGMNEGRKASPIFDVKYYLENNSDLKSAFGNNYSLAYNHYLEFGVYENRATSDTFDLNFYKTFHEDLRNMSDDEAINHYIIFGKNEQRLACIPKKLENIMFDYKYYADNNKDLKSTFGYDKNLLKQHWYRFGIREERDSSEVFNIKDYLNYNKDLQKAFGNNYEKVLKHFINFGCKEERQTKSTFNVKVYRNCNKDLNNAFANNYISYFTHYLEFGKKENRIIL